jgi:hypothetical protein
MEATTSVRHSGNNRPAMAPPGSRSAAEIRRDIVAQRQQLSRSVDQLRSRWSRATDIGYQVKKHRTELLVGAAVVGFLIGGAIALRRRG